ncbi:uncharacterized protein TNCV_1839371 [Trichonephila clavipes]|nr:uncharacterized protein TNCV_1839371 [Trichonephila clavipes]
MRDIDGEPIGEKNDLSWTFSVIDVNGVGKYFRSVVKENIAHYYYEIAELRFLKRSVLLGQADEFLPGDVLTVRIEVSCMSYTGPTDQRDFAFHGLFLKDASTNDDDNNLRLAEGAFGAFEAKRVEFDPIELLCNLVGFLKIFFSCRTRSCIGSNTKAMRIDLLSMTDSMDKVKSTYLGAHPLFQIYMALKEKIRKVYSEPPSPISADISAKENLYFDKLIFVESRIGRLSSMPKVRFFFRKLNETQHPWLSWSIEIEKIDDGDPVVTQSIQEDLECEQDTSEEKKRASANLKRRNSCSGERNKMIKNKKMRKMIDLNEIENVRLKDLLEMEFKKEQILLETKTKGLAEEQDGYKEIVMSKKATEIDNGCTSRLEESKYQEITEKPDSVATETEKSSEKELGLKEAISYIFKPEELIISKDSNQIKRGKWDLHVETMDGVSFTIPFENGEDSFGSKLISCSPVFVKMLRNPMLEKLKKRLKIIDIDCQTFINLLIYLQKGCIEMELLSDVCDLYELADKYYIQDLMRKCSMNMTTYFSPENVTYVKSLATKHSDNFLLQLVKAYENQNMLLVSSASEVNEYENLDNHSHLILDKKQETEPEFEFDFYH